MRLDSRELAAIFAGGFAGAVIRAGVAEALPGRPCLALGDLPRQYRRAFALGYFTTRLQERLPLSAYRRPLLGTGFCGALTTFSTMQLELLRMLDAARPGSRWATRPRASWRGFLAIAVATNLVRRARLDGMSPASRRRRPARRRWARWRGSCSTARSAAGSAGSFPCGTFAVNLSGAFAARRARRRRLGGDAYRFAATGLRRRRSRPSAPGCSRATGSARTDSSGSALAQPPGQPRPRRRRRPGWAATRRRAVNHDCLKLTTYYGERERAGGGFLADAFVDIFARHRLQTSLVLRGGGGFGAKQHLRTDRLRRSPKTSRSCRSRSTPARASRRRCASSTRCGSRACHARARPHADRRSRRRSR